MISWSGFIGHTYRERNRQIPGREIDLKWERNPLVLTFKEKEMIFNTHQYLTKTALDVLRIDIVHREIPELCSKAKRNDVRDFFDLHLSSIMEGSMDPDLIENDPRFGVATFAGHFYDPDTGRNYLKRRIPTTFTRFLEHAKKAKKLYEENNEQFALELGRALHYLGDAGEPHHAANLVAKVSNHLTFEKYVRFAKNDIRIAKGGLYYAFQPQELFLDENYEKYCQRILSYTAHFSKRYKDVEGVSFVIRDKGLDLNTGIRAIHVYGLDEKEREIIHKTMRDNLENCQDVLSAFLLNFLKAIRLLH